MMEQLINLAGGVRFLYKPSSPFHTYKYKSSYLYLPLIFSSHRFVYLREKNEREIEIKEFVFMWGRMEGDLEVIYIETTKSIIE